MEVIYLVAEQYKLLITILVIAGFPKIVTIQNRILENMVRGRTDPHRRYRAGLLLKIISAFVLLCLLLIIWGIELRGLLVVGSSLFAMLGVALFAGWSLLSNLTSFLLLFIQNDCRVGHWVRVVDGANFVEGRIIEMGLMNVVMENIDGNKVIYPNNLFIVRPVMVLTKPPEKAKKVHTKRLIGKTQA
ncbi:mechanosensitive ion channel family protein [Motilimonas cestriensis]|uniref:Small-conductance mechanosensitive channel n=1 Tax=Motilimonas cestriensis TaxID=2742685 RepID=A0ABS8WES2_9GAMM|nr:mechanosensitive ion channel domain-containing protein [Motilimonas cestriensis]MCE2596193.1 mechanosensitive ion channel family protein [Motilimonas cestriensis]